MRRWLGTLGLVGVALFLIAVGAWVLFFLVEPSAPGEGSETADVVNESSTAPVERPSLGTESTRDAPPESEREPGQPDESSDEAAEARQLPAEDKPALEEGAEETEEAEVLLVGRVIGVDGAPVAEAKVGQGFGLGSGYGSARRPPRTRGHTSTTDPRGLFHFSTSQRRHHYDQLVIQPPAPYVFAVARLSRDGLAQVPADEFDRAHTRDIPEFVVERGAAVEGRVTDSYGSPVAGATILLGRVGPSGRDSLWHDGPSAVSEDDGSYRLDGVLPGSEAVTAYAPGYLASSRPRVEFDGDSVTREVDFTLEPLPRLTVQVTDGQEPVAGVTVTVGPASGRGVDEAFASEGESDETGEAVFTQLILFDREARILAKTEHAEASKDITVEEYDFTVALTLIADATVNLRPVDAATGESVLLQDLEPGEVLNRNVPVHFESMRAHDRRRLEATLDEDGTLRLARIRPGEHTFVVSLLRYQWKQIEVDVQPGSETDLGSISLEHGPRLRIIALTDSGEPVPEARVRIQVEGSVRPRVQTMLRTDAEGRCETLIGGSRAEIWVRHNDYLQVRESVDLRDAGSEIEVRLELARGGVIKGTVYDEEGNPVADQRVTLMYGTGATLRTSNEQGRFEFNQLEPRRYLLEVAVSNQGFALADEDDPRWFDLGPGETIERDVHLTEEDADVADGDRTLGGTLLFHNGSPAAQMTLEGRLQTGNGDLALGTTRTDAYGEFEFDVNRDRIGVIANNVYLTVTVSPGRDVRLVKRLIGEFNLGTFRLPPLGASERASLRIHVVDGETGQPRRETLRILSQFRRAPEGAERLDRTLELEGESLLEDLPPTSFVITFHGTDEVAVVRQDITLEAGETGEVRMPVYTRTSSVTVHVRVPEDQNVRPRSSATIVATSEEGIRGTYATGAINEEITVHRLAANQPYTLRVRIVGLGSQEIQVTAPPQGRSKQVEVTFD